MRRRAAIAVLCLLCGLNAAEAPPFPSAPIRQIRFVPDRQPYIEQELMALLPFRIGESLDAAKVRAAIEQLYATGRYADIQIEAWPAGDGVEVRVVTEPAYFVGRVTVEGAPDPPNAGALSAAARLDLGAPFDREDLPAATENVLRVLAHHGFFEPRVRHRLEYDPRTQQVSIRFEIERGPRARYEEPEVTGSPGRSARELARTARWRGWFRWRPVTESRTQEGLERLRRWYQKRDHLAAEVALNGMQYQPATRRVKPSLEIRAGPRIRIEVEGAKVSRSKLRELVPVYQEGAVDRDLLAEGARELTEYFQGRGYFHAKVEVKARPDGDRQLIVFDVERGPRQKLVHVGIAGNRYFDTATIRERMAVRPAAFPHLRYGRFSDRMLEADLEAIAALYRSNGFRDVQVRARVERGYRGKRDQMAVHVQIEEGPQWRVAALNLEGVSPEHENAVRQLLQSTEGQPFSEAVVAIDRENVLEYYANRGYADASFQWSWRQADEPHRAELTFTIREGTQQFVRDILLSGLRITDPALVRERLLLRPGDPLSRSALLETQRRLYNLQVFAKVDAALQNPGGREREKYVLLDFDESRRYSLTTGFGAQIEKIGGDELSFEAPAGKPGFSPRVSLDIVRSNLWGNGHSLSLRSRISTVQKRGIVSYEAPQFRGSPDLNLLLSVMYDDSRDVRTFTARRQEGSIQLGQRLSRANTLLYRFTYRRVTVDPETLKISPLLIPLYSQPARLGILSGNFVADRRDDPTNATRGTYTTLDIGWASRAFGSQADFARLLVQNSTYHRFGFGHRYVLARSATFGWLHNLREGTEIPLPERFFAGGAESHRGFPQNQAGPRDLLTGFPLGGRALLLHKLELRFPLLGDHIGGVLFEDAGNLYSGLDSLSLRPRQRGVTDFDYMVHAVGFGVRYRTPIGPIRVDLAYTFNPPSFVGFKGTREELLFGGGVRTLQRIGHFQFHFSLGQAF
ncbi:MAG: BamA/TamA family outer membrane protein [Bryobacteraceae bacterium]|nr:BamA/TamA family outer membrane protein [Bryobacteraceae bacterium]